MRKNNLPASAFVIRLTVCTFFMFNREKFPIVTPSWSNPISSPGQYRALHTTISRRGLEEFFDSPENWGEANVKSGKILQHAKRTLSAGLIVV